MFGGVEFAGGVAAGLGVAEVGLEIAGAIEGEAVAGDEALVFRLAAAGFLLGDGAGEAVEIGAERGGGKGGEGCAGGGELLGGLLRGLGGLGEGELAGGGVAVGVFEDFDTGFEIAQGLAGTGEGGDYC